MRPFQIATNATAHLVDTYENGVVTRGQLAGPWPELTVHPVRLRKDVPSPEG
jgi:hypothetical protein